MFRTRVCPWSRLQTRRMHREQEPQLSGAQLRRTCGLLTCKSPSAGLGTWRRARATLDDALTAILRRVRDDCLLEALRFSLVGVRLCEYPLTVRSIMTRTSCSSGSSIPQCMRRFSTVRTPWDAELSTVVTSRLGYFSLKSSHAPTTPAVESTRVPSMSKRLKRDHVSGIEFAWMGLKLAWHRTEEPWKALWQVGWRVRRR